MNTANQMEEIAARYHLKLYETFKIKEGLSDSYQFTERGLRDSRDQASDYELRQLLIGEWNVDTSSDLITETTHSLNHSKKGENMEYKPGDKILIVKKADGEDWNKYMKEHLDTIMTITGVNEYHRYYRMEEDNGDWAWFEHMIVGPANTAENKETLICHANSGLVQLILMAQRSESGDSLKIEDATKQVIKVFDFLKSLDE